MSRGCIFRPSYTAALPDGTRERRKSPTWWIQWRDGQGIKRRRAVGPKKRDAEDALTVALREAVAERSGLPTQNTATMLVPDLVRQYLEAQAPLVTPKHHELLKARLGAVVSGTRAVTVRDLTAERMDGFLAALSEQRLFPRTVNCYLSAAKAMFNWAVSRRLLPFNPLSAVAPRSEKAKAIRRRALSEDECCRLLAAALAGPVRRLARAYKGPMPLPVQAQCARDGRRNALAYRIMLSTGLRFNELLTLTWADVDLEGGTLTVREENAKTSGGTLPLPPDTVDALRRWKIEAQPKDKATSVVEVPVTLRRSLAEDLRAAGISSPDSAGRVVDIHALRHTYASRLCRAGVDPKTLQTLLRHASPVTSLDIYVHADRERVRAAAASLPPLTPAPHAAQGAVALREATNDAPIDTAGARLVQEVGGASPQVSSGKVVSLPTSDAFQAANRGSNPLGDVAAQKPEEGCKSKQTNVGVAVGAAQAGSG